MAQHAILRFAKHKAGHMGALERLLTSALKEKYASNPDADITRSKYNFYIISPSVKYRQEIDTRIKTAGCRTRKDSTMFVDTLITASPEFFKGRNKKDILGNRAQLSKWQDEFHSHVKKQFPILKRGESALITRRKHIPTWLFKQSTDLSKQQKAIDGIDRISIPSMQAKKRKEVLALLAIFFAGRDIYGSDEEISVHH